MTDILGTASLVAGDAVPYLRIADTTMAVLNGEQLYIALWPRSA
jgi:hypothetical protein